MLSRKGTSTLMKISLKKPNGVTAEYKKIKVGGKTIKILIVRPENASSERRVPGVLWIHGGGYMLGMPEMVYMSRAIDLVTKAGAVVLSPDYTLSLRAPYPTALRECHAALLYMAKHAKRISKDSTPTLILLTLFSLNNISISSFIFSILHSTVNS